MTDPLSRNRLGDAASPYLLQHADNPVNWQPWDDTALDAAKTHERPIFLSVGYAACHWCHVMAEESFEDETVAQVLNSQYVPIKVDREERPDVDRIYQTICQLVTRGGGWPLSAWLTPDGRPFYVGTYFPLEGQGSQPGFVELLEGLAETWEKDRDEIENRADEWSNAIVSQLEGGSASISGSSENESDDADLLANAAQSAIRSADREHGGFGTSGPKFPQPARLRVLLRYHQREGSEPALTIVKETLDAMASGGMYDHIGGGFHRYATDSAWRIPHFEKMLYDNATLPLIYLAGNQLFEDSNYEAIIAETLDFLDRELSHPEGGFYSSLDAQSELDGDRIEGAFYTWTTEEIRAQLADEQADIFIDRFGIGETASVEGRSVVTIEEGIDSLAETYDQDRTDIKNTLYDAKATLRSVRADRPRPNRDEKILAGWNGLAIQAFAEAGLALDFEYARRGADALEFIQDTHWDGHRLNRRYLDGEVGIAGYLDDYAALAAAATAIHGVTGDLEPLEFALELADVVTDEFWDRSDERLYYTPDSGEQLLARPQELTDQSTPSSLGMMIETFLTLDQFRPDSQFGEIARAALDTYHDRIRADPLQHSSMILAADQAQHGLTELTIVGSEVPTDWRERIGETYLGPRLLTVRPEHLDPWLEQLGLASAPPIWADRGEHDGEVTAYACRNFTCSPPTTDIDDALEWATERLPS